MSTRTVVPIPPSYTREGDLETESTIRYLKYLHDNGIKTVMTTAGTSQFNLLTIEEIHKLNEVVVKHFPGRKIIGIPALSTRAAIEFVWKANQYVDQKTNLMALYPDRYYDDEIIKEHILSIRNRTSNPLYIHGMFMRAGRGGTWNYTSMLLNDLYEAGAIKGIKEEHSSLNESYNFVSELVEEMDVIVAGGSMRRHQFLRSAGANAFLAGIGNLFPEVELKYCQDPEHGQKYLDLEKRLFSVFMKNGWHQSLRIALNVLKLTCKSDRAPWPLRDDELVEEIKLILKDLDKANEK